MERKRLNNSKKIVARKVTQLSKQSFKGYYQKELPDIKWDGTGQGVALCPFHDDRKPSLSVNARTGMFNCHSCDAGGNIFEFHKKKRGVSFQEAAEQLRKAGVITMKSKVEAAYDYTDRSRKLLFQALRYEGKQFSVRRPDGEGGWINNIKGVDLVPYNLPNVIESKHVWIAEGEKDADTLIKHGLTGTCNPFGAGKWKKEYNKYFRGKRVRIIPDNDAVGREHALSVARSLHGIASMVKVIEIRGLEKSEDVTDWFEKGGTKKELIEIARQTPQWSGESDQNGLMSIGELYNMREQKIEWLVEDMLAIGGLSILGAKPKVGKSTLARFLALCVAHGKPFLGREVKEGGVIYYGLEEIKAGIREHFTSMGAESDDDIYIYADAIPPNPMEQLKRHIENTRPALAIIDPLFRFVQTEDSNNYAQMVQALDPLLRIARETRTHIMVVHHAGKGRKTDVVDMLLGSIGIAGTVDTIIVMKEDRWRRRMITTNQRYGDFLEESELIFDRETRTLHIGNKKTELQEADIEGAICEFLSAQDEAVTEAVIDENVVGRKEFQVKALRNLVTKGKVLKTGHGRKNDPFKYSYLSYSHNFINKSGTRKQETEDDRKVLSINNLSCSHKSIKRVRLREQEPEKKQIRAFKRKE